ncbi:phosphate/phosphite/phosphonate ABC transporter, periplasmic binding protein [Bacteriovorax sp. BSW11_IV]|uniref:phosphate/phosphite/phosphonate ABC transporter substrate-binding protein n=1 Tax=Bacteriovorax sp. BSW11_IV TaxID=1353529 RepID=UPI00038A48AF|nr:phosphate/phosphite/phosphonate ABC transporter substrate-binding protein [Bacteriovorax sp. BSW11_IV]EQC49350.1 phosphate/phosphite/phosphonate ABC transporter, periplasmic binding protein [Bacteriovorax sp. BSW11_IV]
MFRGLKAALLMAMVVTLGVSCQNEEKLGSKNNPVKLYFTPSVDADTISSNSVEFIKFLEAETGLFFQTGIPTNYVAVVEAFGSARADIGVMNSFGYLMANEKYGATAKLRVLRYGHDYYQGQILAHVDSDIKDVKDLEGKKFAFTDPSSTSGYMFPLKILKDNNVTLGNQTFAIKHDNVVTMIYQKQVDGGATYYSAPSEEGKIRDARERVKTQFPDVEEKVKIVAITEKIPNDPFVFRKDLDPEVTTKFIAAVKKFIATEAGQKIFKNIYSVEGIIDTTDADYDGLRAMVKSLELDASTLVK